MVQTGLCVDFVTAGAKVVAGIKVEVPPGRGGKGGAPDRIAGPSVP